MRAARRELFPTRSESLTLPSVSRRALFGSPGESDALGLGNGGGVQSLVRQRGGAGGGRRRSAGRGVADARYFLDYAAFGHRRRRQESSFCGDDGAGQGDRARKGGDGSEGARPADAGRATA